MKKLVLLFVLLAVPAQAAELGPECFVPAGTMMKQAQVGADYVPGVDAKGRAVVPADIGAMTGPSVIPEPMVVPVTIDLAKRVGIPTKGAKMEATMGFLEIFVDGRVFYNGQDLSQKVNTVCLGNRPVIEPSAGGQPPSDVIEYAPVEEQKAPAPKPAQKPAPPKVEKPQGELIEGGDFAD